MAFLPTDDQLKTWDEIMSGSSDSDRYTHDEYEAMTAEETAGYSWNQSSDDDDDED